MAKLKVKKVDLVDESGKVEAEDIIDPNEVEDIDSDDPENKNSAEDVINDNSTDTEVEDTPDESPSGPPQGPEVDLVVCLHTVKNGFLVLASRTYKIVDHEVSVLRRDLREALYHGLTRKG